MGKVDIIIALLVLILLTLLFREGIAELVRWMVFKIYRICDRSDDTKMKIISLKPFKPSKPRIRTEGIPWYIWAVLAVWTVRGSNR